MKIENHTMQSRVSDIKRATQWYETLLGRAADFVPSATVAEWQLYPGCWLAVIEARPDPGRNRIRLGVKDMHTQMQRIRDALNASVSEIVVVEGIVAYCDFEDPDANRLGLFQDISQNPLTALA